MSDPRTKKRQPAVESALLKLLRETAEHHDSTYMLEMLEAVEREAAPAAMSFGLGVFGANDGEALNQPVERLLLAKHPDEMQLWDRLTDFCEESQRTDGRFPQDAVTQVASANRNIGFLFGLAVGFRLGGAR